METSAQVGRGERRRKGSLTIFAGYFSGTGKTYRMLEAAGRAVRPMAADADLGGWL